MNDPMATHGAFSWNELITSDVDRAVAFYTGIYGWETEDFPMPDYTYKVVKAGGNPVGGIMPKPPTAAEMPDAWVSYVTVDDVDAAARNVLANGGKIAVQPFDIPQVGRACHLIDPTGACLAMIAYLDPERNQQD